MPIRVHFVKSARPWTCPEEAPKRAKAGVKVGLPYYWWNGGPKAGKQYSVQRPRRSQLTRTRWAGVYAAEEAINRAMDSLELLNAVEAAVDSLKSLQLEYQKPAKGRVRAEARYRAKIERLKELIEELGDFAGPLLDLAAAGDDHEEMQREIADLDWDMPAKSIKKKAQAAA